MHTDTNKPSSTELPSMNETSPYPDNLPQKKLTGPQMKQVLKICGKNCPHFAKFLNRSDNFVYQGLGYNHDRIPLTYYDALKVFVGEENFLCALRIMGVRP